MATETLEKPKSGTAAASPEQEHKWVSIEEAENLERFIFKNYVRKNDEKDNKKFYYKILGMHPYQPAGLITESENQMYKFEVQKYHRNKTGKFKRRDEQGNEREVTDNIQVDAHEFRNGKWILVDSTASFFIDTTKFKEEFQLDNQE